MDYQTFVTANHNPNKPHHTSKLNYLNLVYLNYGLPPDFIMAFQKLCSPDFIVVDGLLYNADLLDRKQYAEFKQQGKSNDEIQYWMNLILVSDLFCNLSDTAHQTPIIDLPLESAMLFGKNLADSWNATIIQKFGELYAVARYFFDEEYNEAYVTLGDYRSA